MPPFIPRAPEDVELWGQRHEQRETCPGLSMTLSKPQSTWIACKERGSESKHEFKSDTYPSQTQARCQHLGCSLRFFLRSLVVRPFVLRPRLCITQCILYLSCITVASLGHVYTQRLKLVLAKEWLGGNQNLQCSESHGPGECSPEGQGSEYRKVKVLTSWERRLSSPAPHLCSKS